MDSILSPTRSRFAAPEAFPQAPPPAIGEDRRSLRLIGAVAAVTVLLMVPVQMAVFLIWPLPGTALGWFALFQSNWLVALIDLDLLMAVDYVLLGLVFLALYEALRPASPALMSIALLFELVAMAAYFSSNVALEMLTLSGRYAAAGSAEQRLALLAAGEAMLATWEGSAFVISYVLSGLALLFTGAVMLRTRLFGRATAWAALVCGVLSLVPASAGRLGLVLSLLSLIPLWLWLALVAYRLPRLRGARSAAPTAVVPTLQQR